MIAGHERDQNKKSSEPDPMARWQRQEVQPGGYAVRKEKWVLSQSGPDMDESKTTVLGIQRG